MKVLFTSPNCLLDPSSGASISCRSIIEGLASRGHKVNAFSATIFDRPRFSTSEKFLHHVGAQPLGNPSPQRSGMWGLERNGVTYLIQPTQAQLRMNVTCGEEMAHQATFKRIVERMKPDVVMAYGGRIMDRDNYRWLKDQKIPVVFYLANPNYHLATTFRDISAVITDTEATVELYKKRLGIKLRALGKVIARVSIDSKGKQNYVSFINPSPNKGSTVLVGIAQEAQRRGLSMQFLVVESRDRLERTLKKLGLTKSDVPNITCVPVQEDMNVVWSRTKILLSPSLWHESGSRTIVEACSAGIPVVATNSGGTPELLGDAGFVFPIPTEVKEEEGYLNPVNVETAAKWTDMLERLLNNQKFYDQASERSVARWSALSEQDPVAKLEELLRELAPEKKQSVDAYAP